MLEKKKNRKKQKKITLRLVLNDKYSFCTVPCLNWLWLDKLAEYTKRIANIPFTIDKRDLFIFVIFPLIFSCCCCYFDYRNSLNLNCLTYGQLIEWHKMVLSGWHGIVVCRLFSSTTPHPRPRTKIDSIYVLFSREYSLSWVRYLG